MAETNRDAAGLVALAESHQRLYLTLTYEATKWAVTVVGQMEALLAQAPRERGVTPPQAEDAIARACVRIRALLATQLAPPPPPQASKEALRAWYEQTRRTLQAQLQWELAVYKDSLPLQIRQEQARRR